jgi:hypothetical protein
LVDLFHVAGDLFLLDLVLLLVLLLLFALLFKYIFGIGLREASLAVIVCIFWWCEGDDRLARLTSSASFRLV